MTIKNTSLRFGFIRHIKHSENKVCVIPKFRPGIGTTLHYECSVNEKTLHVIRILISRMYYPFHQQGLTTFTERTPLLPKWAERVPRIEYSVSVTRRHSFVKLLQTAFMMRSSFLGFLFSYNCKNGGTFILFYVLA